ncbi:DNRLRE domain-containing protein [Streptomyces sp. p1417]|uniref:DNRLRE domain-containing protein n=1 Tax=Streptomyces typhae TaxID=2681492 RepID=A0A6L6WT30_9ACTN|nr:LamG-like jellyroll fold domain-containing protein [Streptomyces typhae]MVO83526.1 DNRLRE domain-containing protein [Streptomyces typhae]
MLKSRGVRRARRTAVVVAAVTSVLAAGVSGLSTATAVPVERSSAKAAAGAAPRTALTDDAAARRADESGKRVEVIGRRSERAQTFANPDGTFTVKEFAQPVRTWKGDAWADIDTTLVEQPNGTLAPKATPTAVTFSGGGEGPFATMGRDGRTFSLSWPGRLPAPEVEGATATYRAVLPDVDLVVRAEPEGFAHLLVVKSAKAAANPALAAVDLPVTTRGVTLGQDARGGLVAKDTQDGGTVFEAPQPVMWDSSGESRSAARRKPSAAAAQSAPGDGARVADVGLGLRRDVMTLKPDLALLRGEHTRYPVIIDPVARTKGRTAWTWVSSAKPTLEGWKFPNSDDGVESGKGVGRCPANYSVRCTGSDDVQRQYYALPTGSFEGKKILKAEFAITLVHTYNSEARSVQLHRVNSSGGSAINSRTNWSNRPSSKDHITSESPTHPTGSCTATNQNVRFNVQGTVQKAASSGWDTTTFGLQAASEDSYVSWKRFCNNAALEVTYNRPPYQPKMGDLTMDSGGSCAYGEATKHYTKTVPTLSAEIWDADHGDAGGNSEKLRAQFEIFWTDKDGKEKKYAVTTDYKQSRSQRGRDSGVAGFSYKAGEDIPGDGTGKFTLPQNTVIGWWVRGGDDIPGADASWGPWSHEGSGTRCEFILDSTKPAAPDVKSEKYPNDDEWHDGVGDYGTFELHSEGTDVVKYRYQFTGEEERTVTPTSPGRPVTVRWMPRREAPMALFVRAEDRAGNTKDITRSYRFRVAKGRSAKASWGLSDPAGSKEAVGDDNTPAATAGSGVTFGEDGPHGSVRTAATLNGGSGAYLNTGQHVVDTDKTFSVAAWVQLPELPKTSMSVVSQDGSARSGFSLGYDATSKRWSFLAPDSELDSMVSWEVQGPRPVPDEWTHLVGVYDKEEVRSGIRGTMRMYVNGMLVKGDVQQRPTAWNATGSLQIGRALEPAGYTANLKGTVADVQVFDRVLAAVETESLGGIPPRQRAYWDMDESDSGTLPDRSDGKGLTMHGGSSVYQADDTCDILDPNCKSAEEPVWGDGHLSLDGKDGYASRTAGLLKSRASFTITARARLSSPDPKVSQTVFALPGTEGSAASVRFDKDSGRWKLRLTDKDASDAVTHEATAQGFQPSSSGDGDHLALSYNALFEEVRLYVNGQWTEEVVKWPNEWNFATAGFQVGRAGLTSGSQYFSGAIDEVRVFEGAFDEALVATVASLESGVNLDGTVT